MGLFQEMADTKGDDVDLANVHVEQDVARAVEAARAQVGRKLPFIGFCYNCGEGTPDRFCSPDCRDDYEHRQRRERAN